MIWTSWTSGKRCGVSAMAMWRSVLPQAKPTVLWGCRARTR